MLLIAHRGDTNSHQENTPEAFVSAFDKGAKGVELDIQLFKGKIIVVHDYLFDTSTDYVSLEEVLTQIHARGRIEIEIKAYSADILVPLHSILEKFLQADFELTTSEIPLTPHIKKQFPNTQVGLIFQDTVFQDWMTPALVQQKIIGWAKLANADRVHISYQLIRKNGEELLVKALHDAGYAVHSHIPKSKQERKYLANIAEWGVDQCTIDSVDLIEV